MLSRFIKIVYKNRGRQWLAPVKFNLVYTIKDMSFIYSFFILVSFNLFPVGTQAQKPSKLFTLLSKDRTNVGFENILVETKDNNIFRYENFYSGGGVGIGDFNRDGLADIYFTGNQVGDQLYINQGDLEFENVVVFCFNQYIFETNIGSVFA